MNHRVIKKIPNHPVYADFEQVPDTVPHDFSVLLKFSLSR